MSDTPKPKRFTVREEDRLEFDFEQSDSGADITSIIPYINTEQAILVYRAYQRRLAGFGDLLCLSQHLNDVIERGEDESPYPFDVDVIRKDVQAHLMRWLDGEED